VIPRPRAIPLLLALAASIAVAACSAVPGSTPAPATPAASAVAVATSSATQAPTPTVAPTATPTAAPAFPATLTDDEGTAVTIPAEPTKIVSLTPAATETLFALGAGSRVVGKVEDFNVYPPEAAKVPDVAKFGSVDVEKIVAMGTQLVIAGGSNFNPPEAIAKLRSLGVPTLVIFAPDIAGALKDIGLVGAATGKVAEAKALTTSISTAFDEVKQATSTAKPLRVYYELDATNGYFGPAPDYFGTEMIKVAGGQPLTSGTNGVYQIDAEKILAFDPEVILLGDAAYGVTPAQVAKRPGWDKLTAVKNGAVRPINDVIVTRPGPRLGEGIRELALAIHPDLVLPSPAP
jgi:iron complex transport system substrate-binding protein